MTSRLPPRLTAWVDQFRRKPRETWGGPFNGQRHRQAIVRELAQTVRFDEVVETGAFRGTTTEFLADTLGLPVKTVEAQPRYYHYSRRRLRGRDVEIALGDSRGFLRDLAGREGTSSQRVLFYLDAHWESDLPLPEELRVIAASWPQAVVLVDDFEVPGDPGYGFDDYGPGRRLSSEILPVDVLAGWGVFYPSAPSAEETGLRRGSVVLASPAVVPAVAGCRTLSRAG